MMNEDYCSLNVWCNYIKTIVLVC